MLEALGAGCGELGALGTWCWERWKHWDISAGNAGFTGNCVQVLGVMADACWEHWKHWSWVQAAGEMGALGDE